MGGGDVVCSRWRGGEKCRSAEAEAGMGSGSGGGVMGNVSKWNWKLERSGRKLRKHAFHTSNAPCLLSCQAQVVAQVLSCQHIKRD